MPRNRHPLSDLLHVGLEPASVIELSEDIGPFTNGTTVQEFLEGLDVIIEALYADGFTLDAVKKKTIQNIPAWNWTRRLSQGENFAYINGLAYANGVWVAVGDVEDDFSGKVFWTRDPEGGWNHQPGWPQIYYYGVATDGTTWAIAGDSSNSGYIWTSSDPTRDHHWTERLAIGFGLYGIYYASSRWVAWGNHSNGFYTATSATGTWTFRSISGLLGLNNGDFTLGNGTWVAAGGSGYIATASDPTGTWTNHGIVGVNGARKIKYANGYWLICGSQSPNGGPWYATSPTGPWTRVTSPAFRYTSDMIWDGTRWVVIGASSSFVQMVAVATDPSGTWTSVSAPDFPGEGWRIAFDGRVYVVSGIGDDDETALETALSFAYTALTVDAYIARKLTLDATINRTTAGSLTADATLLATLSGTIALDAVVAALSFTADAVIYRESVGSFTADAFVHGQFTLDALITGFTVDAVIVSLEDGAFSWSLRLLGLDELESNPNPYQNF